MALRPARIIECPSVGRGRGARAKERAPVPFDAPVGPPARAAAHRTARRKGTLENPHPAHHLLLLRRRGGTSDRDPLVARRPRAFRSRDMRARVGREDGRRSEAKRRRDRASREKDGARPHDRKKNLPAYLDRPARHHPPSRLPRRVLGNGGILFRRDKYPDRPHRAQAVASRRPSLHVQVDVPLAGGESVPDHRRVGARAKIVSRELPGARGKIRHDPQRDRPRQFRQKGRAGRSREQCRKWFGLPRGALVIGTVGRLVPVKNHLLLLGAFARVKSSVPEAHLAILGGGELENAILAEAARLGLRESISIIPPTPAVPLFLGALDIFALSSNYEGLPLSILEAYASGLPAVATSAGGDPRGGRGRGERISLPAEGRGSPLRGDREARGVPLPSRRNGRKGPARDRRAFHRLALRRRNGKGLLPRPLGTLPMNLFRDPVIRPGAGPPRAASTPWPASTYFRLEKRARHLLLSSHDQTKARQNGHRGGGRRIRRDPDTGALLSRSRKGARFRAVDGG